MRLIKTGTILIIATFLNFFNHSCEPMYSFEYTYIITEILSKDSVTYADSVSKLNYGFRINYFEKRYPLSYNQFGSNVLFATTLPSPRALDSIVDIKIKTLNKINETYPANFLVNDIFIGTYYFVPFNERESLDSLSIYDLYDNYYLNDTNITDTVHQFIIEVYLDNNTVLTDTTTPIKIY